MELTCSSISVQNKETTKKWKMVSADDEENESGEEKELTSSCVSVQNKETTKKRKMVPASQINGDAEEVLSKNKQQSSSTYTESSDFVFAKYIGMELESIEDGQVKDNLKIEILKLLCDAKVSQRATIRGYSEWHCKH